MSLFFFFGLCFWRQESNENLTFRTLPLASQYDSITHVTRPPISLQLRVNAWALVPRLQSVFVLIPSSFHPHMGFCPLFLDASSIGQDYVDCTLCLAKNHAPGKPLKNTPILTHFSFGKRPYSSRVQPWLSMNPGPSNHVRTAVL